MPPKCQAPLCAGNAWGYFPWLQIDLIANELFAMRCESLAAETHS